MASKRAPVVASSNTNKGKRSAVNKNVEHMKAYSLSEDSVLPYGMFITKIVKYFNVNLQNEINNKKLKSFDTYDQLSLRRMHFVCNKDGSWEGKSFMPPSDVDVSSNNGSSDEENENEDIEGRGAENENAIEISSNDGQEQRWL
ncbi:hypothetical protein PVL29_013798 [Vitis rotundifolia]|uniref:Uncharacterized protein n=1 Tax=Vitis rotundifolia TaxID=103349 RepID=A0AA39DNZ7_VITRO|nr:hypothetical protein PVL29_013798 [Vitis rotundifolia]